jgi:hypothetical protein
MGGTLNTVTSTQLSAHHMPGSARDHLPAHDRSSCWATKQGIVALLVHILSGSGSRLRWSAQNTVDNGATVGSGLTVEISMENGKKTPPP